MYKRQVHLCSDIKRLASPQNFNGGPTESLHKVSVKEPGRNAKMESKTFEENTAAKYVENLAIGRSYLDHPNWEGEPHDVGPDITYHGCFLTILAGHVLDTKGTRRYQMPLWCDSYISSQDVLSIVRDLILPNLSFGNSVRLYSKTKRCGSSFSAHPSYGRERLARQDWAMAVIDGDEYPVHLLCFLLLSSDLKTEVNVNGSVVKERGYYALCHTLPTKLTDTGDPLNTGEQIGTRAHHDQHLIHRIPKWKNDINEGDGPPTPILISCDTISGTCIGIPDILAPDPRSAFFILRSVDDWPVLFAKAAREFVNH